MLDKKKTYLQIAFNRSLGEIAEMIGYLPLSDRIIIEVGYPLIKYYGTRAISTLRTLWTERIFGFQTQGGVPFQLSGTGLASLLLRDAITKRREKQIRKSADNKNETFEPYVVADLKCMDRAFTEVEAAAGAGASAATCLARAPLETVDAFIEKCERLGIDSMLDMINIDYPFEFLSKLKTPPNIIMLHRGVDEGENNREKEVPYHQIEQIKDVYDDVLIAVAGGETVSEVMRGSFNDADILIVWKEFNENPQKIAEVAKEFLRNLR